MYGAGSCSPEALIANDRRTLHQICIKSSNRRSLTDVMGSDTKTVCDRFRERLLLALMMLVLLCAAPNVRADSVSLLPVEDATISERYPDSLFGGDTTLESGADGPEGGGLRNRALLKFDPAANIPSNAIVTSAALTLTLVVSPSSTNLWFSLHKVFQDWSESAVTWTNRLSPPVPWSAPGGTAPLDYSSSVTQSNLIIGGAVPVAFTFASNPAMVANVQEWASNPANNFGWMLICELEELERSKRKFGSSERITTTQRPSLAVQFTLPAPPLTLTALPQTNGQFQFQFNAESNRNYTVLYGGDFDTTNWMVLTNIAPLPGPENVLVSDALLADSNRFYRVRTP